MFLKPHKRRTSSRFHQGFSSFRRLPLSSEKHHYNPIIIMGSESSDSIREWSGFQRFSAATQTKLLDVLGVLKQQNVSKMTILVMGKCGVGKSSTVNSIFDERAAKVTAFQAEEIMPKMVSRTWAGFTLNIVDTPGLVRAGYVDDQVLDFIKQFLLNKTIDVLLYVDRLDVYRVDTLDKKVIRVITESFGEEIWRKSVVILTHAQFCAPDGLSYDEFVTRRSEALLKTLRVGAQIRKKDFEESPIPVALVENSERCNKNDDGEKIVPNDTAWISDLVKLITSIAINGSKAIFVDSKLVDGPNPNAKGKLLIPFILAFQYFFVGKWILRAINSDIATESRPSWEMHGTSSAKRKF